MIQVLHLGPLGADYPRHLQADFLASITLCACCQRPQGKAHLNSRAIVHILFRIFSSLMDPEKHSSSTSLDDDFESDSLLPNVLLKYRLGADFEKKRMRYLLVSLFGIAVYTLAVMGITVSTLRKVDYECRGGPHLYPNLLEDAIEYRLETFADNHKPDHPYFGEPGEEVDHNWHELTKCK